MTAPTGEIKLGAKWWQSLLTTISFGRYKVTDKTVTITPKDSTSGVGADGIQYYIYTGNDPYTTVEALKAAQISWETYGAGAKPTIAEGAKSVIYAKLIDRVGNATYISSDGILLDETAPVISDVQVDTLKDVQATVSFTVDEASTYYYAVLLADKTAPEAAEIIAASVSDAVASGSGSVTDAMVENGTSAMITADGLQVNTAYKIYIVTVDQVLDISDKPEGTESGNISAVAAETFTTAQADIQNAGRLALEGNAVYDETLTAVITWNDGINAGTPSFSWYRDGEEISGATGSAYQLTAEDVGTKISVKVTAPNCSGSLNAEITATQNGAPVVQKADCPAAHEAMGGIVDDENNTFRFAGKAGVDYEYSTDGGENWNDVTDEMVTESAEELTGTIFVGNVAYAAGTVQVRAKETDVYKAGTKIVSNGQAFTAALEGTAALSGTVQYGETLTAEVTGAQSNAEFTYSFYRSGSAEAVQTGSGNTYQLRAEDVDSTISVKVTAAGYIGELSSSETAAVARRPITVTADAKEKVYGEVDPELTYKITDGSLLEGDVLEGKLSRVAGEDADSNGYAINQGTLDNRCYEISFTGNVLTITPKTLTVEAGSYKVSKVYDGTTDAGSASGQLKITGILDADTADVSVDAVPAAYRDANVGGQDTVSVSLTLAGRRSNNYQLAVSDIEVPCEITPKEITPGITVEGTYTYTGNEIRPDFTVEAPLTSTDYTVVYADNINAGTGKILLTATSGSNYTWQGAVEATFTIEKAEYTGLKTGSSSAKYGNTAAFDLTSCLPEGAKLGTLTVSDTDGILAKAPVVAGSSLSYAFADKAQNVGKTAVVTIPVTETRNYKPFDITVTLTVAAKEAQEVKFTDSVANKTYGDADFTNKASAAEGSTIGYASSDPAVATVDGTGKVHILKAGTTVITATASETSGYTEGSASYTLKIAPVVLTWDTSDLTARDKEGAITDKKATLYGSLKVSGILASDAAAVTFTCPAEKLSGTYILAAAGEQKVTLAWADAEHPVSLQGEKAANYVMPASLPEITGTINPAGTNLPTPPESTASRQYRLEQETGVSRVPDTFRTIERLNTPEKIETEMKLAIKKAAGDITEENKAVYDVTLLVNINNTGWKPATAENFPAGGITVVLPYPKGTGKDTHEFTVAHMFTIAMNGHNVGDVEYPAVTKTDAGIQFKVSALSPICVGWKTVAKTDAGKDDGDDSDDDGDDDDVIAENQNPVSTSVVALDSAHTGDNSPVALYLLLILVAVAGIVTVFMVRRKRK